MPTPSVKPVPRHKARAGLRLHASRATAVALFLLIVGVGLPTIDLPLFRNFNPGGSFDTTSRERLRSAQQENLDRLVSAKAAYEKLGREPEQKLNLALPADADPAGIIVTLDGLAAAAGMQLVSIDIAPRKDPAAATPGAVPVDIGITVSGGDYSRLKVFLASVERNLRIMDVIGLAFSPRSTSYALSLRTYMRAGK